MTCPPRRVVSSAHVASVSLGERTSALQHKATLVVLTTACVNAASLRRSYFSIFGFLFMLKLAAARTQMEMSMLNITYRDRNTNIWVREKSPA